MSAPLISDTFSFLLNVADGYKHEEILRPPIQNYTHVRVISSVSNIILSLNFVRPSYLLEENSPDGCVQITGTCVPSDKTWWEVNTSYIDRIQASIYKQFNPLADSISITLQFCNFVPDQ